MSRATTSASNLFRREICAGSHHAEEGRPEENSVDSSEGTLLHELDAQPDVEREASLTSEQREVLEIGRKGDEQIFRALHTSMEISEHETFEEEREVELMLRKGLKPIIPGHTDRVRYYPRLKVLVIIDKKYGRKEVTSAEANLQLRAYAVMGASKWDCDHVLVAINQPRLAFENRLSIAEYTRADIAKAKDHIIRIWEACQLQDAPRTADTEACRYCKAKVDCDAYRAKFEWLAVPSQDGKDIFSDKLSRLSDADLDTVWRSITFAKVVEASAKAEIMRRIDAGGMEMYEVSDKGKTSTINDPAKATELLREAGLTLPDVMACAELGKERLAEKLMDRRKDIHSIGAAKKALQEILKPVLTVTEKSPFLMRKKGYEPGAPIPATLDNGSDAELFPR